MLLRLCDSCSYYTADNGTCVAFPEGTPLRVDEGHFEVREDQVGTAIYDPDPERYEFFDMFRRINPTLKFPILISYEIPDSDEVVDQVETQAESLVEEEVSEEDPEEAVVEEE